MNIIRLENSVSRVFLTYISCIANDEIMLRQLRHNIFYDFIGRVYIKKKGIMIDYYNNTNLIGVYLVKVIECDIFFCRPKLRKNEYCFG